MISGSVHSLSTFKLREAVTSDSRHARGSCDVTQRHLRRRHSHAGARPCREGGPAIHAVPFNGVVLKTVPFLLPADESFDIGIDTRTGVNDQDYQVPFRFDGKIEKLTFNLGREQLA